MSGISGALKPLRRKNKIVPTAKYAAKDFLAVIVVFE
jgi:hypothetical protein